MISNQLHIGDKVQINFTLHGIVRFIGTTQFKAGTWAGIELDKIGSGKNDGSVNGPSTPYQKKSPSMVTIIPPLPSHELQDKMKLLEAENRQLKSTLVQLEENQKIKDNHIQSLESSLKELQDTSMESIDMLEDLVQSYERQVQQLSNNLHISNQKITTLINEQNDLRKAGLEAIESYELTLEKTSKQHHKDIKVLLKDINCLEIILQSKLNKEIDLTESLMRERHYSSRLIHELKKKFTTFTFKPIMYNTRLLDTPIEEEEEEEEDMTPCALCDNKGHHLIHCPMLFKEKPLQQQACICSSF
ncbi:uncharacterized protein BX663DRAFT_530964 [Cokeromyces recurvatus]|uniref:uncharacterized protein n=1 Tax=Cokeromyces recurvatus TaxID=90255 RepID=UPI002220C4D6|nr:uncharacterized protein BX663DRAFT_530964 [Cokeromyces recurvatus]KAI7903332.1 hypothetical protein BX663DRAFT_530964 [Cokeromyces recurvatus]